MYSTEEFEEELKKIIDDLDKQLEALSDDNETFHHSIIDIISNNPKSKEIIQFIVAINDKIETKHDNLKEVLRDSLKSLTHAKIKIFREISKEIEKLNTEIDEDDERSMGKMKHRMYNSFIIMKGNIKNNKKTYMFILLGILLLLSFLIFPDKFILVLQMYLRAKGL